VIGRFCGKLSGTGIDCLKDWDDTVLESLRADFFLCYLEDLGELTVGKSVALGAI
jgi:hypothetical protein